MQYADVAIPLGRAWSSPFAKWQSRMPQAPVPAIKPEDMNTYGCSLVFGHPQGPTGLRSVAERIETLRLRGGGIGLFTGCAAGDSGAALVVEVTD